MPAIGRCGGIGTGLFFLLDGNHTLGRNESRPARLLDVRDYCKLHIIFHYIAVLLGARPEGRPFHMIPGGRVGADDRRRRLVEEMAAVGIETRFVTADPLRPTLLSACFQYPDGDGGNSTDTDSAAASVCAHEVDQALTALPRNAGSLVALAAPEDPLRVRCHLLAEVPTPRAFRVAAFTSAEILEAKKLGILPLVDLLALNEDEASHLTGGGFNPDDPASFVAHCPRALTERSTPTWVIVSVGKDGAFGFVLPEGQ